MMNKNLTSKMPEELDLEEDFEEDFEIDLLEFEYQATFYNYDPEINLPIEERSYSFTGLGLKKIKIGDDC